MKDEVSRIKQLEKEKKELESALAQAHLKLLAYESLIEVAEENLGIDIKKISNRKYYPNKAESGKGRTKSIIKPGMQDIWNKPPRILQEQEEEAKEKDERRNSNKDGTGDQTKDANDREQKALQDVAGKF